MAINRLNPDYPDAGSVQIVPSSVTVGSGSATIGGNGAVSFTGVSSILLNGVFNSTYINYKAIVNIDSTANSANLNFRYGTNGTTNSNTNYNNRGYYIDTTMPVVDQTGAGKIAFGYLQFPPSANSGSRVAIAEIFNPFETKNTYAMTWGNDTSYRNCHMMVYFDQTTSFTDFQIFPSSNNITGTVSVYGYRN